MRLYRIIMRKAPDGWFVAESKDFDVGCKAQDPKTAISLLEGELVKHIVLKMRKGESLPASSGYSGDGVYLPVDVDRLMRESFDTPTVRRNVTIPTYIDYKLRLYGADVSGLLREAAERFIFEHEQVNG